jgi:hypothetical protein
MNHFNEFGGGGVWVLHIAGGQLGTTAMGFAKGSIHPTICRFVARIREFIEADQSDLACPTLCKNSSVFPNFSLAA